MSSARLIRGLRRRYATGLWWVLISLVGRIKFAGWRLRLHLLRSSALLIRWRLCWSCSGLRRVLIAATEWRKFPVAIVGLLTLRTALPIRLWLRGIRSRLRWIGSRRRSNFHRLLLFLWSTQLLHLLWWRNAAWLCGQHRLLSFVRHGRRRRSLFHDHFAFHNRFRGPDCGRSSRNDALLHWRHGNFALDFGRSHLLRIHTDIGLGHGTRVHKRIV